MGFQVYSFSSCGEDYEETSEKKLPATRPPRELQDQIVLLDEFLRKVNIAKLGEEASSGENAQQT